MKPIIFVAGLGRCGTSLVMQMLNAAGIRCAGTYPDFEPKEMGALDRPVDTDWLRRQAGSAVKWIDPHKVEIDTSAINAVVIWTFREKRQQAKSQAKLMREAGLSVNRSKVARLTKILREESGPALEAVSCFNGCSIRFENLLEAPAVQAGRMIGFLENAGFEFSENAIDQMAAQVVPRPAVCMPDRRIELDLIARKEVA